MTTLGIGARPRMGGTHLGADGGQLRWMVGRGPEMLTTEVLLNHEDRATWYGEGAGHRFRTPAGPSLVLGLGIPPRFMAF